MSSSGSHSTPPVTRQRIRAAYMWAASGTFAAQGLFWVLSLLVMNMLQPADYGLIGLVSVFFALCRTVQDAGITAAIVQRPDLNRRALNSAFWFFLAAGSLLTTIGMIAAPLVAAMKSEPRVLPIVRVLSLTFVIVAARSVPLALMTRALEFRLQTVAELMSGATGSITTLILAYSGFGVWSLVLGNGIVAESALTILAWIFSRWRPRLEFDGDELRSLLRFGVPQTVGVLLWQFYIDSDFLTVGILLGERILGWYTLAWQVAMVPVERLAAALNKANFPVFSSLMKDPAEARAHFRTMVRTIAGIAFPAAAGIAIVGPEFIHLVLKPKWMGAIPVVRQLSVLGALRAVGIVVPSLLSAAGKPKISMVYNIICSIAYPAIFVISAWRWGITGVAWAWVILYPVMTGFLIRMAIQRTPLELGDILTPLKYPLVGTAVMSLAVVMVGMSIQLSPLTHLGLQILTGVLVYASMAVGWLWRTGRLSSLRMGALRDT